MWAARPRASAAAHGDGFMPASVGGAQVPAGAGAEASSRLALIWEYSYRASRRCARPHAAGRRDHPARPWCPGSHPSHRRLPPAGPRLAPPHTTAARPRPARPHRALCQQAGALPGDPPGWLPDRFAAAGASRPHWLGYRPHSSRRTQQRYSTASPARSAEPAPPVADLASSHGPPGNHRPRTSRDRRGCHRPLCAGRRMVQSGPDAPNPPLRPHPSPHICPPQPTNRSPYRSCYQQGAARLATIKKRSHPCTMR